MVSFQSFQFLSLILTPNCMSVAIFMSTCWKWLSNSCSCQLVCFFFFPTLNRLGQFVIDRSTVKRSLLSTPLSKWPVHWIHPYSSMDLKIHKIVRETREREKKKHPSNKLTCLVLCLPCKRTEKKGKTQLLHTVQVKMVTTSVCCFNAFYVTKKVTTLSF